MPTLKHCARPFRGFRSACAAALLATAGLRCAAATPRFALRAPLWVDPDTRPLARQPAKYWSPLIWDAVDHQVFRPLTRGLLLETGREAVNVNALDEVPDSSWYTNRLSRHALTPEEAALGPCAGHPAPSADGAWTVTDAKPNGFFPGVIARGPDGQRYLLKADGGAQAEQNTGADVIGSRIYFAAGYYTACSRTVRIRPEALQIGQGATYEDPTGAEHPMTRSQIDRVFEQAVRYPDGTYRLGLSLFVEGRPLGPFTYEGVRADDPNDVVRHEDRRDVRASRLLAAWLNHFDAREQNTLTTWISGARGGYVRHYFLDFGDCLGGIWSIDGISRRVGRSGYFDVEHITQDWLALGLIDRAWDNARVDPVAWPFGYFRADDFDPAAWRSGYPNPAFDRMTERDAAWIARIVARLTDAHLRAIVAEASFSQPSWSAYVVRTLAARRDRLLARYLTRRSPLADVAVAGAHLCASDRARAARLYHRARYAARMNSGAANAGDAPLAVTTGENSMVCVGLPPSSVRDEGLAADAPSRYRIVEVVTTPAYRAPSTPLRAHLYDLGPARGYVLVGLDR